MAAKTKSGVKVVAENRKARFNYTIEERYEAGMELVGSEVKSLRAGTVNLSDSYATPERGQLYLLNCHIGPYKAAATVLAHEPLRKRRLLLKRHEIDKIITVEPKLKVIKGEATLEPGDNAEGAKILLVSGKERRPLNKELPVRLEVGTDKRYKIVATKEGYETYENFIEFDDGKAEKTFIISLKESSDGASAPEETEAETPTRSTTPTAPAAPRGGGGGAAARW